MHMSLTQTHTHTHTHTHRECENGAHTHFEISVELLSVKMTIFVSFWFSWNLFDVKPLSNNHSILN